MQTVISYAKWTLPPATWKKVEAQYPRKKLSDGEKDGYRREWEMGTDANGDPKGLNGPMIEVVGPP